MALKAETLHWQAGQLESLVNALGKEVVKISYCALVRAHFFGHICGHDPDKRMFLSGCVGVPYQLNDGEMIFAEFDVQFIGNVIPNLIVPGIKVEKVIIV
jgi:hypothetical protein